MDLITTHINADFDALGSLVAAKKLYPNSRLMLPGSQEKAVREFLSLAKELVVFESERECRLYDITRLVLVDTRHKSRIGIASELVDKGVEIHVYDHHPKMKDDVVADKDIYEEVGATVTILADIIKKKGIKLTPLEATIMLLGIYEETGSLTSRTTTKLDVDMASFLLSNSANLVIVSSYLSGKISEEELIDTLRDRVEIGKRPAAVSVNKILSDLGYKNIRMKIPNVNRDVDGDRKDISKKMVKLLPKNILNLLRQIGRLGNARGISVFVVGGLVRDLMLGAKNLDLDIVVEGDAIKFGHAIAKKLDAALIIHRRFGTCSVVTKDRLKIDFATARKEIYEKPAALPTVEFSSLKDDLVRRDFTINAMAVSLNKPSYGQLIDFFRGEKDLAGGHIRVMHDASFIDDPTRIFRAVRFEQRFGFKIDNHTEDLIKHAIKIEMFDKVEPQRIRDEIILILKEDEPLKALNRMAQLDELRFLHPNIKLNKRMTKLYKEIKEVCRWYNDSSFKKRAIDTWLIYFMAMLGSLSYNDVVKICDRFVFRKGERLRILSYKEHAARVTKALVAVSGRLQPSRIYAMLEPLSFEVILLVMADMASGAAKSRVKDFFRKYNGVKTSIGGEDLKIMGLKPCPDYKVILDKVLHAKIDGKLKTKKEEIVYAKRLVERICA